QHFFFILLCSAPLYKIGFKALLRVVGHQIQPPTQTFVKVIVAQDVLQRLEFTQTRIVTQYSIHFCFFIFLFYNSLLWFKEMLFLISVYFLTCIVITYPIRFISLYLVPAAFST